MTEQTKNFEKAAALFWALGGSIPHDSELETEAEKEVKEAGSREAVLRRAIRLCGGGNTPGERYLLANLYSWLGASAARETVRWASAYLSGPAWERLPRGLVRQEGIQLSWESSSRAAMLAILAGAQAQLGESGPALANYGEAARLEPYNAMYPVKTADLLAKTRSPEEALAYLKNQRASASYQPVKYRDQQGNRLINDTFQQLLEAHIRKIESALQRRGVPADDPRGSNI